MGWPKDKAPCLSQNNWETMCHAENSLQNSIVTLKMIYRCIGVIGDIEGELLAALVFAKLITFS